MATAMNVGDKGNQNTRKKTPKKNVMLESELTQKEILWVNQLNVCPPENGWQTTPPKGIGG